MQAPRTAPRRIRPQHQLLAERNDPAAHAGAARLILAAAYAHAFAQIAARFHAVGRSRSHENRGRKNKRKDTAHAKGPALKRDASSRIAWRSASCARRNNDIMMNAVLTLRTGAEVLAARSIFLRMCMATVSSEPSLPVAWSFVCDACVQARGATFAHEIRTPGKTPGGGPAPGARWRAHRILRLVQTAERRDMLAHPRAKHLVIERRGMPQHVPIDPALLRTRHRPAHKSPYPSSDGAGRHRYGLSNTARLKYSSLSSTGITAE